MKTKRGRAKAAEAGQAVEGRVCRRCERSGHANLLWHWQHGTYCVVCIRELMGIVSAFLGREEATPDYNPSPTMFEKGRKR